MDKEQNLWKEASRKLAWAVLSTFRGVDPVTVRHWARGVATGMVKRYTGVYGQGGGHEEGPIDNRAPSTDNERAVEGMRPVWRVEPSMSGLVFATAESAWVKERVRAWTALYGCGGARGQPVRASLC